MKKIKSNKTSKENISSKNKITQKNKSQRIPYAETVRPMLVPYGFTIHH